MAAPGQAEWVVLGGLLWCSSAGHVPYAPFEWQYPLEECSPVGPELQARRLLAAAPSSYEPRLPLALLLPYARALILEPTEHRWQVIAQVCAMIHGLGLPRQERKRR